MGRRLGDLAAARANGDGGLQLLAGEVSASGAAVWLAAWVAVTAGAFAYFAASHAVDGQSPGTRLADVVVVTDAGDACGWRPAALRTAVLLAPTPVVALLDLLGGLAGAAAGAALVVAWLVVELVVAASDEDHRLLGDRLAGTVVVEERLATV